MTTIETRPIFPALGEHARKEAGRLLQLTLVELIALSLIGKQLHWNIAGPGFRELHLHLDELVDEWRELRTSSPNERSRSDTRPTGARRPWSSRAGSSRSSPAQSPSPTRSASWRGESPTSMSAFASVARGSARSTHVARRADRGDAVAREAALDDPLAALSQLSGTPRQTSGAFARPRRRILGGEQTSAQRGAAPAASREPRRSSLRSSDLRGGAGGGRSHKARRLARLATGCRRQLSACRSELCVRPARWQARRTYSVSGTGSSLRV